MRSCSGRNTHSPLALKGRALSIRTVFLVSSRGRPEVPTRAIAATLGTCAGHLNDATPAPESEGLSAAWCLCACSRTWQSRRRLLRSGPLSARAPEQRQPRRTGCPSLFRAQAADPRLSAGRRSFRGRAMESRARDRGPPRFRRRRRFARPPDIGRRGGGIPMQKQSAPFAGRAPGKCSISGTRCLTA